jgi:CheY-like chemotaxis protein
MTKGMSMSLILLVEDSQDLLELYAEVFEALGHRVVTAGDGLEGLALARQWHPDLVVTDWQLPRLDGVAMSRRMRESEDLRAIPILLQSSMPDPHCPWVSAFLSKASTLSELEGGIDRLLTGGGAPRRTRTSSDTGSRRRRSSSLRLVEEIAVTSC